MIFSDPKTDIALQKAFEALEQSYKTIKELEAYERLLDAYRCRESQMDTALEDNAIKIARNLLKINKMSIEEIAEVTNLSVEQLENIDDYE